MTSRSTCVHCSGDSSGVVVAVGRAGDGAGETGRAGGGGGGDERADGGGGSGGGGQFERACDGDGGGSGVERTGHPARA